MRTTHGSNVTLILGDTLGSVAVVVVVVDDEVVVMVRRLEDILLRRRPLLPRIKLDREKDRQKLSAHRATRDRNDENFDNLEKVAGVILVVVNMVPLQLGFCCGCKRKVMRKTTLKNCDRSRVNLNCKRTPQESKFVLRTHP